MTSKPPGIDLLIPAWHLLDLCPVTGMTGTPRPATTTRAEGYSDAASASACFWLKLPEICI